MLTYRNNLKPLARQLRLNMTDAEQKLWFHLRRKQILDIVFYRQKPIGNYIVDFYAPSQKLVVEVDGAQHFDEANAANDVARSARLKALGLQVMRFNNLQVLEETSSVLEVIYSYIADRKSLPASLYEREEHRL